MIFVASEDRTLFVYLFVCFLVYLFFRLDLFEQALKNNQELNNNSNFHLRFFSISTRHFSNVGATHLNYILLARYHYCLIIIITTTITIGFIALWLAYL